mmetsp:Transcript_26699/g.83638  ORF Transcript_26699/g.83638 Transcript_26699/m.83638 type:complete len:80 (+) Transcript_26699:987-1226(+)
MFPLNKVLGMMARSMFTSQKLVPFFQEPNAEDLRFLAGLTEEGKIRAHTTSIEGGLGAIPEAVADMGAGRAVGKRVVRV